jgi:hypothetical protein
LLLAICQDQHRLVCSEGGDMRVISTLLPALPEEATGNRPTVLMAFDTLVDDKSVVVGLTEGVVAGPDVSDTRLSPVGQLVLARCSAHHRLNYPQGAVVLAGVASVGNAKQRVRQVLTQAPEYALVLLVCANGKVYDAALNALGFDAQTAHQQGGH